MDTLKARVEHLLQLRGLTQADATRKGNFNNKAFINDILTDKKSSVRGDGLLRLAAALSTSTDFLLGQSDNPDLIDMGRSVGSAARPDETSIPRHEIINQAREENFKPDLAQPLDPGTMVRDIPVRGIAVGGEDGDFTFNGTDVDHVRRPAGLVGKKDIYALRIEGESMWPAHRHGALVYVDPNRRPGVGEDAVIQLFHSTPSLGEAGPGYLKRVKRVTPTKVTVEQFTPVLEFSFDREDIECFHRVIPWEEVLGI